MSPTTLYREGTDLDGLLAELDARYPGQVRVVEVTHPREGGVLGFFAKQRVGVHYRLVGAVENRAAAPVLDKGASGLPGRDAVLDPRATRAAAAHVAAAGHDAPRPGALLDGFGPDPAAIRAALARRTPATFAAPAAGSFPASPAAGSRGSAAAGSLAVGMTADQAGTAAPEIPAAPGMAFAQILADIALTKAAAGNGPAAADSARAASRQTAPRTARSGDETATAASANADIEAVRGGESEAASLVPGASTAVSAAARTFAAMDFAALTPFSSGGSDPKVTGAGNPGAGVARAGTVGAGAAAGFAPVAREGGAGRAVNAAAVGGAAVLTATDAGTPLITLRRRGPRAVPRPQGPAPAQVFTPADPAAPDSAALETASFDPSPIGRSASERLSADAAALGAATSPEPEVRLAFAALPRVDATGATIDVPRPTGTTQPTGAIPSAGTRQPIAVVTDTAAPRPGTLSWPLTAGGGGTRAAAAARHGVTAVLERPECRGASAVRDDASMRDASHQVEHSAAGHSTPLTLRRKLLEVGVPVDRVPTDAVHVYAAIEDLVGGLAPAPALPTDPGRILAIAGPARDAVAAADSMLAGNPGVFETVWTYHCPAAVSTRRIPTAANVLTSVAQASELATATRKAADGPILVVVATDRVTVPGADTAPEVLDALTADTVWAAVDATRKPADTRRALRCLPALDALVVANAERSTSPATVWELGLPIAMVDGRPSTGPTWAVLLLGKLSELEESGCSAALC